MTPRDKVETVEQYIQLFPESVQEKLKEIRSIITSVIPEAKEIISWDMPTYTINGNICHFAAHKTHIGFYPGADGMMRFENELSAYKTSKGAVQFPFDQPFPVELIKRIVQFRVQEDQKEVIYKKKREKISRKMTKLLEEKRVAGMSYSFVDEFEIKEFYKGIQGYEEPFNSMKLDETMYYDIASLTKVVGTTTRILQLIEEEKLTLDTKVSSLLKEFKHQNVTIENLLMHNSGLPVDIKDKSNLTKERIMEEVYQAPLEFKIGEKSQYSDFGFILLGEIIKLLDQTSLEEIFQTHIFKPLQMTHTSYVITDKKELYIPTECTEKRGCIQAETHDTKGYLLGQSGHAGIFSSLHDLSLFVQSFFKPGLLLQAETIELLKSKTLHGRGLGWEKKYGEHILNHTGFTGTSIVIDLDQQKGFVFLTNRVHPNRSTPEFLEERQKINILFVE